MPTKSRTKAAKRGIPCPRCGSTIYAIERTTPRAGRIERKRRCKNCELPFLTTERPAGSATYAPTLATRVSELFEAMRRDPRGADHLVKILTEGQR